MKKNLLSFAGISMMLAMLFGSCSKEQILEKTAPPENVSSTGNVSPLAAGMGPYDVLGHGYNVTGEFANANAAGFAVIDIAKFKQAQASRLLEENPKTQQHKEDYGENALQYSKKISESLTATTGFAFFKSTISKSFNSSDSFDAKYIYGSYNLTIEQKRYRLNAAADLLKGYLTATFLADLQSKTPQQLVQLYGTHVLIDVYTGSKLEVLFQAETSNQDRTTAARAGIKVGVKNVFDADITNSVDIAAANQNFSRKLSYRTRGGDPTKGLTGEINLDQNTPKLNITAWQNSSTPENAVFVNIGENGLIPLYELIPDATKKAAIKGYIDQYLRDNQVNLSYGKVPVYLYYNNNMKDHFTTLDPNITQKFGSDWQFYGKSFTVYNAPVSGSIPIHEFYSEGDKNHLTTANRNETNGFPGWRYAGVAFYTPSQSVAGTIPVYMFYNTRDRNHYVSPDRNATSGFQYWEYRGIAFYAFP